MSPLLSASQSLPFLTAPQLTPAGALPFALTVAGNGVPLATLAVESGTRMGSDCTMPVADAVPPGPAGGEASTVPAAKLPFANVPSVPAAVLLASLDQSARAFATLPSVPAPRSAKVPAIEDNDKENAAPKKQDSEDASEAVADSRGSLPPALMPTPIPPSVQLPMAAVAVFAQSATAAQPRTEPTPVATLSTLRFEKRSVATQPAVSLVLPTPVGAAASTVSPKTSAPVVARPELVASAPLSKQVTPQSHTFSAMTSIVQSPAIAALPRQDRVTAPVPVLALPGVLPTVAENPATGAIASPQPADGELPVAAAQIMKVDTPELAQPNEPAAKSAEPLIRAAIAAVARPAATAETSSADAVDKSIMSSGESVSAGPVSTPAIVQPSASLSSISVIVASSPSFPDVATIDRQLDLARGDAWLDTLARDIVSSADGNHRLRFGLSPEHLGKLDVEVSRGDTGMSIYMTTRNDEARAVIAAAQPRLVEELRLQGTRVASTDVSAQADPQSGHAPKPQLSTLIEAVVEARASAASHTDTDAAADGLYA